MHVRHALKNIPVLFSVKQQGEIICGFDDNLSKEQKFFFPVITSTALFAVQLWPRGSPTLCCVNKMRYL